MEELQPSQQLSTLIAEEWEARLRHDPLFATETGDHRFDDRLPTATEEEQDRWQGELLGFRRRLDAVDPAALKPAERLNRDILGRLLDGEIAEIGHRAYRLPMSKVMGFPISFAEDMPLLMPFSTVADYDNYLSRLTAFARFAREQIGVMRLGLRTGYRPVRCTLVGLEAILGQQMVAEAAASPLYGPFTRLPPGFSAAEGRRLAAAGSAAVLGPVASGYRALLRFLEEEYLPGARDDIAARSLPNGADFYRHRIRLFTSLDLSPERIHEIGLAEVARISAEMDQLALAAGFSGGRAALIESLRTDPGSYAPTPEALLKETAYVLKRIDGELPRLFKTLPRTPYGIRTIPAASAPGNTTAYYFPAPGDGTAAGFYYVNTYDLPSRPLYEIEALSLHEAAPGHHLQFAIQQELDLPPFRRFRYFTEFIEGWALYAERLGLEVGFYQDLPSNFGRLSYEMWRACRLVVDTGMHALGWSRRQAIDHMAENTSSTPLNIANEIDRYIAWPGQALAYKIGELKIRELRGRAETALGNRFDRREFHDVVLGSGAVPLDLLEGLVDAWIASTR